MAEDTLLEYNMKRLCGRLGKFPDIRDSVVSPPAGSHMVAEALEDADKILVDSEASMPAIDSLRRELIAKLAGTNVDIDLAGALVGLCAEYASRAYMQGYDRGYEAGLPKRTEWECGCGHVNGSNLRVCSQCGRRPGEQL